MATPLIRFGAFRLDPQARELFENGERVDLPLSTIECLIHLIRHRDRPVGRDELASAVWGRVDVSEVSLSHAIVRLRRRLGDDGNAQRVIRTVPRLGYRWVMPDTVEEPAGETPAVAADAVAVAAPPARGGLAIAVFIVGATVALAFAVFAWRMHERTPDTAPPPANSALVLPVRVDAGAEWAWLRLGLMDLVATELRRGGLATTPSETVVAQVQARGEDGVDLPAAWRVTPHVAHEHAQWHVRLDVHGATRDLAIDARAADPLRATRDATDELLIKLGRTPPADDGDDDALAAATLRQRAHAALLANQFDVARRLVEQAAPGLQASPEIALIRAKLAFYSGDYEGSRRQATELFAQLPPGADAGLRARVANTLASAHFRLARLDDAERVYADAIRIAQDAHEPDVLAHAYLGRGGVASQRVRLEAAAADFGRARTLFEAGNDPLGVAAIDLNLAINAMQRGQPATALPLLERVRTRLRALAAVDALAATEVTIVEAQLVLLDHDGALATSAAFVAPDNENGNPRRRWQFTFARAAALAGSGRLDEADLLLARLRDASDPDADAIARALAESLSGEIALARGEPARAAEYAAGALTPVLAAFNREQYVQAWCARIRALQRAGAVADAAAEIERLRAQVLAPGDGAMADPGAEVLLALAGAEQAEAERRPELALQHYADAMARATARAVPEELVRVGAPYVRALVAAGRVDEAASVHGRIAAWADRDLRAAWSAALVYHALGQAAAVDASLARARALAGQRSIAALETAVR
ncbi:DNA-binding winged helix-turn-helix (wHTH) protein/tetratricopeptide (TPR) repeat protein [Dokdonella fugitiva]|uniref:DNA-binding winged helix-turn-helix (WHTH) protein/tetratricopeptide (TPR) repeat protein n=1 Tax=Dokdonella fugitiva TaxID=328517 RepID=A0A839EX60_9GAMM|nr:winged helix-turn-helix domain-containing protein [Dokdonella fugitiva]MBA8887223.1 DNA-binding winged helix-turn-helix (wHTH) protein/tetratricopeptide (TPR) repeat protein [Dokdonella fugitiva]